MAIEFGSRKETFENYKVYETMLADPLRRDLRDVQCRHEPQAPRRR